MWYGGMWVALVIGVVAWLLAILETLGLPIRIRNLTPAGWLNGAQTTLLIGILLYCMARYSERTK